MNVMFFSPQSALIRDPHFNSVVKKSWGRQEMVDNVPKMWKTSGPLLTFILQPLEYPPSAASSLKQLFVDLFKHSLHLPWRCLIKLLWDRKPERYEKEF